MELLWKISSWICAIFVYFVLFIGPAHGWHDLTNVNYHCWPIGTNVAAYSDCPGVHMEWIKAPPDTIKAETWFNTTYRLEIHDEFYEWAFSKDVFNFEDISNASMAKDWCENIVCPSDLPSVSKTTCCVHHVNVHSCPLEDGTFCGPWIPPSGDIYTHSDVLWGSIDQANWTSTIKGLYKVGTAQLIAHFKVANMQMTIFKNIVVNEKTVCGDLVCEEIEGESCSNCPEDCGSCPLKPKYYGAIILPSVAIVGALIGVFVYFCQKQRKLLYDEGWIIPFSEIQEDDAIRGFMGSAISVGYKTASMPGSQNRLNSNAMNNQVFTNLAKCQGKTVALRYVSKTSLVLTKSIRKEVKLVRSLDSPNLAKFVGACVEVPNVCILMEYCPKGSLNDVLLNDDIPLNWGFRFSFAGDIAKGMAHLHDVGIMHGRLKSQNCIIDDRWTCKITDFGIPSLRSQENLSEEEQEEEYLKKRKSKVYIAPETVTTFGLSLTPHADVYSYSIILVEISTRNDIYEDEDPDELPIGWKPAILDLTESADGEEKCPCPQSYTHLINQCWCERPADRPTFAEIRKTLQKINPNRQSPVDMMMSMMEKYSKHLETIVAERTADLMVEKQKTDRLLYSMLPKPVADDLKMGKIIDAVQFSECTIYFSDIVGFTNICGGSTAMQVVALLNKLYICFDSIVDKYDVYKVETIGDAYMVVSGVPQPNGHNHAKEIACMAIDLVKASETFVIPHFPKEKLKIRVGMHSGPVCAGVVGLKMPRYCLFGDTVNTSSRMESNGEAYKIHMSDSTNSLLAKIGGFKCELRGTIPVKGKGEMKTWWLLGLDSSKEDKASRKISTSNDSGFDDEKHAEENRQSGASHVPETDEDDKLAVPRMRNNQLPPIDNS